MGHRYVQPLRIIIQWGFMIFVVYLGIRFAQFVGYYRSGGSGLPVSRPPGIEAFLPISGLLGIKDWMLNGAINRVHPAAVVILLTVICLSILLKRSFCSWICPIGTLSEQLWKGGFRVFRRNIRLPDWLDIPLRGAKYLLLAFFLVTILWRMPAASVTGFIQSDYHKVADVRLLDFFMHLSGGPLGVILFLVLVSIPVRNAFCRYLCPYGALLGLVSSCSPVKVSRESSTCVSCGVCNQFCPSYIPVMSKDRIHSPECIGCWRCISNCRAAGALEMKLTGSKVVVNGVLFAVLVLILYLGGTMLGKVTGNWGNAISPAEYSVLLRRN